MRNIRFIEVFYDCFLAVIFLSGLPLVFSGYQAFQFFMDHSVYIDGVGKTYSYVAILEELHALMMLLVFCFVFSDFFRLYVFKQKINWKKDLSIVRFMKKLYFLGIVFELCKQSALSVVTPDKSWSGAVIWALVYFSGVAIFKVYLSYLTKKEVDLVE